jgi:hypothetical protein
MSKTLKKKRNLFYLKSQFVPRCEHLCCKTDQLMLYTEKSLLCFGMPTRHTNVLWWQKVELLDVKHGGTCSEH